MKDYSTIFGWNVLRDLSFKVSIGLSYSINGLNYLILIWSLLVSKGTDTMFLFSEFKFLFNLLFGTDLHSYSYSSKVAAFLKGNYFLFIELLAVVVLDGFLEGSS